MKKTMCSFFLLGCLLSCAQTSKKDPTDDRKDISLGVSFSEIPVDLKDQKISARAGILIETVYPFSSASEGGLRSGDIIIGSHDRYFYTLSSHEIIRFFDKVKLMKIGDNLLLHILRPEVRTQLQFVDRAGQIENVNDYPQDALISSYLFDPAKKSVAANWQKSYQSLDITVKAKGRDWRYGNLATDVSVYQVADKAGFREKVSSYFKPEMKSDVIDLEDRFHYLASAHDPLRLPVVTSLQNNPYSIYSMQNDVKNTLKLCRTLNSLWTCLENLTRSSGLQIEPHPAGVSKNRLSTLEDYLQFISLVYLKSQSLKDDALKNLSREEIQHLYNYASDLLTKLEKDLPSRSKDQFFQQGIYEQTAALLQKVKVARLIESSLVYQKILNEKFLAGLKNMATLYLANAKAKKELKINNLVFVLGDSEDSNYTPYTGAKVQFIIDVGGHDYYPDVDANIIDFAGNDTYESSSNWNLDSGFLSTRFLYDETGDDQYISAKGGISSSYVGSSLLIDLQGNDIYDGQSFSVAVACTGFSVLADLGGNDRYRGSILGQGVGLAGGLGFLLDADGNDQYYSQGALASSYGDAGQFSGWSQGVGVGFRSYLSGGWGLLYDGGGQDRFTAGTFSQGGGYYFGIGQLISAGPNDDFYSGARYSQGFSAHYAIGTFLDEGGNDTYLSRSVVALGLAWDLSLSLFVDQNGNDSYHQSGHFMGSAQHNSFSFFIDENGIDNYTGGSLPYEIKDNSYHGGQSLGLFIDQGAGKDKYKNLQNSAVKVIPGWQILVDE